MRSNICLSLLFIGILTLVGCDDAKPVASNASSSGGTGLAPPPLPTTTGPIQPVAPAPNSSANQPAVEINAPASTDENTNRVVAETGVGKKGHYENGGYIGTVVSARFRAEETLIFGQVQRALDLYKAEHNGKGPRSHDVFMKDVIEFNNLNLPELPAGERYEYNPADGQLYVLQPK